VFRAGGDPHRDGHWRRSDGSVPADTRLRTRPERPAGCKCRRCLRRPAVSPRGEVPGGAARWRPRPRLLFRDGAFWRDAASYPSFWHFFRARPSSTPVIVRCCRSKRSGQALPSRLGRCRAFPVRPCAGIGANR
jgi:hypothetical protein